MTIKAIRVNCRTGSLERAAAPTRNHVGVNCRTGSLEKRGYSDNKDRTQQGLILVDILFVFYIITQAIIQKLKHGSSQKHLCIKILLMINFLMLFNTTLNYLTILMANVPWEKRQVTWEKIISAKNPSEYGIIIDELIKKSNPQFQQIPHGTLSNAVRAEIEAIYTEQQTDFQSFHPQTR